MSIPRFVYVYLLCGEQEVWLVDSGVAGSESLVFDYLKTMGRQPEDISLVIQTHSHPDHLGATSAIKQATGCGVAAHEAERAWIEDVDLQERERPVPEFRTLVGGSVKLDRSLHDGDVLHLEDRLALHVLHTPGHSRGSISLWCPVEHVLICGDAVPLPNSIPIYEDADESMRSVKRLLGIDGVEVLLSSWDEPRRLPDVQRILTQRLDYLHRIHDAVVRTMAPHATPDPLELCQRVVADLGLPEVAVNPLVVRTFMAHLARLTDSQSIRTWIDPIQGDDFAADEDSRADDRA